MNIEDLALAYWRLEKWVRETNVERKTAATSSLRQIKKYLDEAKVEIKDLIGQKYDIGLAVDVINTGIQDVENDDLLIISETLSPIIMQNGEIIKYGKVILGENIKEIFLNEELPMEPNKAKKVLLHNIQQYCGITQEKITLKIFLKISEKLLK